MKDRSSIKRQCSSPSATAVVSFAPSSATSFTPPAKNGRKPSLHAAVQRPSPRMGPQHPSSSIAPSSTIFSSPPASFRARFAPSTATAVSADDKENNSNLRNVERPNRGATQQEERDKIDNKQRVALPSPMRSDFDFITSDDQIEEERRTRDSSADFQADEDLGAAYSSVQMLGHFAMYENQRIGAGRFGTLFLSESIQYPGRKFAVKVVDRNAHVHEATILSRMNGMGSPTLHYACHCQKHIYLVMDLCGQSLDAVHRHRLARSEQQKVPVFSLSEVSALAINCLKTIRRLHNLGYLHSDIKPSNFVFQSEISDMDLDLTNHCKDIQMVDFGLSRRWSRENSNAHVAYTQDVVRFSGTVRYASVNTHAGRQMSRRDDLESLGYMILHLLLGRLPWQGLSGTADIKSDRVFRMKGSITIDELCKDVPERLKFFFNHVKDLKFAQTPDYDFLIRCLSFDQDPCRQSADARLCRRKRVRSEMEGEVEVVSPEKNSSEWVWDPLEKVWKWVLVSFGSKDVKGNESNRQFFHSSDVEEFSSKLNTLSRTHEIKDISHSQGIWFASYQRVPNLTRQEIYVLPIEDIDITQLCEQRKARREFVSAMASSSEFFVLVFKASSSIEDQQVLLTFTFPKRWISNLWKSGYFVSLTCSDQCNIFIAMNKFSGQALIDIGLPVCPQITSQRLEVSFHYPSEQIHHWWNEGFFVTQVVSIQDMTIFVLSNLQCEIKLEQRIMRTGSHESDSIHRQIGGSTTCVNYSRIE